jgi:hypothetical protein
VHDDSHVPPSHLLDCVPHGPGHVPREGADVDDKAAASAAAAAGGSRTPRSRRGGHGSCEVGDAKGVAYARHAVVHNWGGRAEDGHYAGKSKL